MNILGGIGLRKLTIAAIVGLIIYIGLIIFPTSYEYPNPDLSIDDLKEIVENDAELFGIDLIYFTDGSDFSIIDVQANNSLGRYIESKRFNQNDVNQMSKEFPLYYIHVMAGWYEFYIDPVNEQLIGFETLGADLSTDELNSLINELYGATFSLDENTDRYSLYVANSAYEGVKKYVHVSRNMDDEVISMEYEAEADNYQSTSQLTILLAGGLFSLLFFIALTVAVTVHAILLRKELRFNKTAFLMALIAAISNVILTNAMLGIGFSFLTMIDATIWAYNTFLILLIRFRHRHDFSFNDIALKVRKQLKPAISWTLIGLSLTAIYFYIAAKYFAGWMSPVDDILLSFNTPYWTIPILTFAIGFSAAIFEESIFRHYMIPIFDKLTVPFSIVATSVLWGVLHFGYDMAPWYLYILEFIIITGPLFYIVYKRHGFTTAILVHYFYNAWAMTTFAFTLDIKIALISLLVVLIPLLTLFTKEKT